MWKLHCTVIMKSQIVGCFIIWRMYVAQTNDTDCLVIALGPNPLLMQLGVWLEFGLQANNTQMFINVKQLHDAWGAPLQIIFPYRDNTSLAVSASLAVNTSVIF